MKFTITFLICAAMLSPQAPSRSKKFSNDQVEVVVHEAAVSEGGTRSVVLMPVLHIKLAGNVGDEAQVTILYNKKVQLASSAITASKPVDPVLTKASMCPVAEGADSGCDYIEGVSLDDVAWVRVKLFKTVSESEAGRPVKK